MQEAVLQPQREVNRTRTRTMTCQMPSLSALCPYAVSLGLIHTAQQISGLLTLLWICTHSWQAASTGRRIPSGPQLA